VSALRKYVDTFLSKTANLKCGRQIISLGAGFDTLFFQLQVRKNWKKKKNKPENQTLYFIITTNYFL